MTIDEALKRVRDVREFIADCDAANNGDTFSLDLEALDMVLAVASGKADPRQMALPVGEGKP